MERQTLFLRSLFTLLVASYVAYACSCRKLTLEQSLCPEYNKTVIMANVQTNDIYLDFNGNFTTDANAPTGRYEMKLEQLFKNGTVPLETDCEVFSMYFPRQDDYCGRIFNISDSYVFFGRVDSKGNFYSDNCETVIPAANVLSNTTLMDILECYHPLNCTRAVY